MSEQRTVLIGVTGCIAAYKSCEVVRGLQKAGLRVKVVMTQNATRFVGPVTFKTLTREPVAISLFDEPGAPVHHVSLAKEADLFLIAPATANVMAKVAHGIADDLLTTTVLATTAPILIAPAMNTAMWQAAATQDNLSILRRRGFGIIEPDSGYLACGDTGAGKLAPVETIVAHVLDALDARRDLCGKKVLITAGPTHEAIDPVRFIGNRSSGLTGYELARVAHRRGADVVLVSGPTALASPVGVAVHRVTSAGEMLQVAKEEFASADIAIFSAAVSDFRPKQVAADKIKKDGSGVLTLDLVENPDIIACLASDKGSRFVVGFAAETEDVLGHAREKLVRKHADLIVANDVSGALGFGTAENRVWLVDAAGAEDLGVLSKTEIAERILDAASTGRP
ncbi:MAG: bifunctional phosphopantothenoylcysteine decarboxylase/phosphopantothenate--cysteine ligase CoaBC [Coriobacteriales bacterium]|nr:bifunctional phosphopantothenoylcysteine decarboxylase/phosphopantothenate--cysteine ligase CoaBC [Coriobacteriales bacterium]